MGEAKQRQADAQDAVELIEDLVKLRIKLDQGFKSGEQVNHVLEQIEVTKRSLTDYFLVTDPRRGIYVNGPRPVSVGPPMGTATLRTPREP